MILSLLFLAQAASAPALNCAYPDTQLEMNVCSYRDYQAADKVLNAAWKTAQQLALQADRDSPPARKADSAAAQLLAAQRAWIAYRDAHCLAMADQYRGGSIRPLIHNSCMTDLTKTRTAQLREYSETN